jgi:hypothetical protein
VSAFPDEANNHRKVAELKKKNSLLETLGKSVTVSTKKHNTLNTLQEIKLRTLQNSLRSRWKAIGDLPLTKDIT